MIRVQPGAMYTLSIEEPQVSGSPTPTISYAWRWKGQAIGTNSRFVPEFVFGATAADVAGELSCTVTASNVAGSASRVVSTAVDRVQLLPLVSRVTIRDASTPTTILQSLPESPAGITLRAGGPTPAEINPVVANGGILTYTWTVDGVVVGTQQTVTLGQGSTGLVVVSVQASNADGESSASGIVPIGDASINFASHIGGHNPTISYFNSGVAFANLIYASVSDSAALVRGQNNQGSNYFGTSRFSNWSGDAYYTADGWPYKSDLGPLSSTNAVHAVLVWDSPERMWSALGLGGVYDALPSATELFNEDGTSKLKASYSRPIGIAGRDFKFDVTCYWEGIGVAAASNGYSVPSSATVTSVSFTGPDGDGPFGDGPRTMSRSTTTITGAWGGILAYIIASDETGVNPLRNLIVVVSNVRDATTDELVYAGFDHTTYRPFQLYPQFVESMRHLKHIRSLHNDWAHFEPNGNRFIFEHTDVSLQKDDGTAVMPIVTTGWNRPQPTAPGFEKGFAALNRPTNVGFGKSLRAIIEICNQLNADLWWCHPVPTVAVGTRNQDGTITYASQPGSTGELLVDNDYVNGFADEIAAHLNDGLAVYSEWANEVWNWSAYYWHASTYAYWLSGRTLAPEVYGGDGGLWHSERLLGASALNAGTVLASDRNHAMVAFSAAASAMLAKAIRDRLGAASSRQIVCVAAGQSAWADRSAHGLGQFWAAMPKLFKQIDAVAHAPYRSWWQNDSPITSDRTNDNNLVALGANAAWEENETVRGMLRSYAEFPAQSLDSQSWWATNGFPSFLLWKSLALDHPQNSYQRRNVPPNWPANKRRWNLKLITYEGGNHHIPLTSNAKLQSYPGTMHPSYEPFTLRYMETVFARGPKGLTTNPVTPSEIDLYRPGMVPLGIVEDSEPLHDRFTFLVGTSEPSFRHGMFWGLQWWNGHINAPQAAAVRDAVLRGVGTPDWYQGYTP